MKVKSFYLQQQGLITGYLYPMYNDLRDIAS